MRPYRVRDRRRPEVLLAVVAAVFVVLAGIVHLGFRPQDGDPSVVGSSTVAAPSVPEHVDPPQRAASNVSFAQRPELAPPSTDASLAPTGDSPSLPPGVAFSVLETGEEPTAESAPTARAVAPIATSRTAPTSTRVAATATRAAAPQPTAAPTVAATESAPAETPASAAAEPSTANSEPSPAVSAPAATAVPETVPPVVVEDTSSTVVVSPAAPMIESPFDPGPTLVPPTPVFLGSQGAPAPTAAATPPRPAAIPHTGYGPPSNPGYPPPPYGPGRRP